MLENAKKYEDQLRQLFFDIAYDPFYKYEQFSAYSEVFKIPDTTFNSNHFVSVFNGKVIGYIEYQIKRPENSVWGLEVVHFGGKASGNSYIFGKDLFLAMKDIFEKFGFRKISFCVRVGNPVEKTYNKLIKRYNGHIVGVRKQEVRLMDGQLYDEKWYEIFASDYFKAMDIFA